MGGVSIAVLFIALVFAVCFATVCSLKRRSALLACTVAWAVFWGDYMTIWPIPPRLVAYNMAFGEAGRIALGVLEMACAAGLVGVGFFSRASPEIASETGTET